ncbi:APC family permease [Microbacterium kribbense]
MKRSLGPIALMFAAIGSIIGSGWLFGAFNASALAGPAAIFSWAIAAVMIILIGLTYAELGPMFPISGGVVRYPHLVWGSFGSYSMGFVTWIAAAAVPAIEVTGALQYASRFFPFTTAVQYQGATQHILTPVGMVVAVLALALFVVLNYFGVLLFARINNVVVWWKLFVIVLVIVVFLIAGFAMVSNGARGHAGGAANFTDFGFAPKGFAAVFTAVSTAGITFSFLGFRQGIELAGETKNPKRNIPLALVGSVVITGILYMLLQVAFTVMVPTSALKKSGGWINLTFTNDAGPLAALAAGGGLIWLAYILYFDAIVSPADTGLIYTTITARVSYAMGRNANAPKWLAANNKHGVPHWSLLVAFLAGCVLLLPFPSWQALVGFITSATVMSFGTGPLVLAILRKTHPERPRPFKLPGGNVIPYLAFWSANMIMFWAGWGTNSKLLIMLLIGYVLLIVFQVTNRKGYRPPLFFTFGASWVIPWFILYGLVSFFFSADSPIGSLKIGGTTFGDIMFFWVFLINAVVAGFVYWLAVRMRLPKEQIDLYIEDATRESEVEEETVAGGHIG